MPVRILLVAATGPEAETFRRISGIKQSPDGFLFANCEINPVVAGVGSPATAWTMTKWLSSNPKPDLALNIGIAGSYRDEIRIGDVVMPVSDCFADSGVETEDSFLTLSEAGLEDPDIHPFTSGRIIAGNKFISLASKIIKPVNAISVNRSTGSQLTIEILKNKFNPDIETMEGSTFFYICSREKVPFLALRSISNMVEPSNREKWNIPHALENLSEKLKEFLLILD